ncbi:MAG: hypothetical protein J6Y28_05900 [Acholeplasmatales bacterium]|nr:hypothetical protein [Acholeplasmatales bacterium]
MKKLLSLLLFSSLALAVAGCSKKDVHRPIELAAKIDYFDTRKQVSDVKITNVPKQIKLGYLASENITLNVSYLDGTKSSYHITEEFFPKEALPELKTEGDKNFDFIYKGNHMPLKFKHVASTVPMTYEVKFLDETGKTVETKYVNYLEKATCTTSKLNRINNYMSDGYYYKFTKTFDQDLDYVYKNVVAKPIFDKYKTYGDYGNYYNYLSTTEYERMAVQVDEDLTYHSLIYVGRLNNVASSNLTKPHERTTYNREQWQFRKYESGKDFYENVCSNLSTLITNNYNHEKDYPKDTSLTITNTNCLDLNLNKKSSYELGTDSNKFNVDIQDCFTKDFSRYTLDTTKKRKDGSDYSFDSVFDKSLKFYQDEAAYNSQSHYKQIFSEDYAKGFYSMDFTIDMDVYLDVSFKFSHNNDDCLFELSDAKLAFGYVAGSAKYSLNYSTDNHYEYYGNKFSIYNSVLAETLYQVVTH